MKAVELKLLCELMKNSRKSDRELAKAVGTSQPTVSRNRQRLEKEGVIKEYTMLPDLTKLGINILALTFASLSPEALESHPANVRVEKAKRFIDEHPNVLFVSSGRGLEMGRVIVTVHKSYSDYVKFIAEAEEEWSGLLSKFDSFLVSLTADKVIYPLSLKNLMQYIEKTE